MGLLEESVRKRKNVSKIIKVTLIIILLFIGLIVTSHLHTSKIYTNIFVETIDVGKLTSIEASEKVHKILQEQSNDFNIDLTYEDEKWKFNKDDLGFNYLINNAISQAYNIGREGNMIERIKTIYSLYRKPKKINVEISYDINKIKRKTEEIQNIINEDAIDAQVERKRGVFIVKEEVLGVKVQEELLQEKIIAAVKNNYSQIIIPIESTQPKIIKTQLDLIKDEIGSYNTIFTPGDTGRNENIKISLNSINNIVLMPGEEFSFNESTGPRSIEEGYKEAPIIINGELVPGIGGGICQVSTTLYQAVVRANIEVTSRRNHGLPVSYVPMGQDATVAYGYIDFKFKNNRDYPIYLEGFIKENKIFIKLYSKKTDNISIQLESEIVETIEPKMKIKKDPEIYTGETIIQKQGKKGYRVNTYKIYFENGKEIKKEVISKDYYPPREGIIIEGDKI